jgi:hypothetical protein
MKLIWVLILCISILNCANSKVNTQKKQEAYNNLISVVESKYFEIMLNRAEPQISNALIQVLNSNTLPPGSTPSNIFLNGYYSLKIIGDTIRTDLPYYGERFFGVSPGSNSEGIIFNDIPKNYMVKTNQKKRSVEIMFRISDSNLKNEWYDVLITVYSNFSGTIFIQSANRSLIKYSGEFKVLENSIE